MKPSDVILLGLKRSVAALSRADGTILWSTELGGGLGDTFVTVLADEQYVFAYAAGHLHCLELGSGVLLWTNKLAGYGYGLASLCLPGGITAPDAAAIRQRQAEEAAHHQNS